MLERENMDGSEIRTMVFGPEEESATEAPEAATEAPEAATEAPEVAEEAGAADESATDETPAAEE